MDSSQFILSQPLIKGKDQFGNTMVMSKVIRLMSKTDLVKNCLNYFQEMGVPAPDKSTIFHYLAKCFPGMYLSLFFTNCTFKIIIRLRHFWIPYKIQITFYYPDRGYFWFGFGELLRIIFAFFCIFDHEGKDLIS